NRMPDRALLEAKSARLVRWGMWAERRADTLPQVIAAAISRRCHAVSHMVAVVDVLRLHLLHPMIGAPAGHLLATVVGTAGPHLRTADEDTAVPRQHLLTAEAPMDARCRHLPTLVV